MHQNVLRSNPVAYDTVQSLDVVQGLPISGTGPVLQKVRLLWWAAGPGVPYARTEFKDLRHVKTDDLIR